ARSAVALVSVGGGTEMGADKRASGRDCVWDCAWSAACVFSASTTSGRAIANIRLRPFGWLVSGSQHHLDTLSPKRVGKFQHLPATNRRLFLAGLRTYDCLPGPLGAVVGGGLSFAATKIAAPTTRAPPTTA